MKSKGKKIAAKLKFDPIITGERNKRIAVGAAAVFMLLTFATIAIQLSSLYRCINLSSENTAKLDECLDGAQRLSDISSGLLVTVQLIVGAVAIILVIKHKRSRQVSQEKRVTPKAHHEAGSNKSS